MSVIVVRGNIYIEKHVYGLSLCVKLKKAMSVHIILRVLYVPRLVEQSCVATDRTLTIMCTDMDFLSYTHKLSPYTFFQYILPLNTITDTLVESPCVHFYYNTQ